MRTAWAGTVASLALVLPGCGGFGGEEAKPPAATKEATTTGVVLPEVEEPPPTASRLVGTWSRFGMRVLFRFDSDGTFAFDRADLDNPFARGTYELDGGTIRFSAEGPNCTDTWSWKVGITGKGDPLDDVLHAVFVEEGCGEIAGSEWELGRVSPESL